LTNNKLPSDDEKEKREKSPEDYDNDFIDDETPKHEENHLANNQHEEQDDEQIDWDYSQTQLDDFLKS